ncbi:MAG TPA: lysophospholipid acyltransferase family protein [Chloroflexota bacterium]|jgi:1-acyl-sn-glycerol-3-phosphate acyltransferase
MTDNAASELPVRSGSAFYRLSCGLARLVMHLFTRAEVAGLENFPRQGGVLVVSNHLSIADPPILAAITPRPLTSMGKSELFSKWLQGRVLRAWGVFPVRRGEADRAAVRGALAVLQSGGVLLLFPEGTRRPGGLGEGRAGVAYLAARSGCPVLPVAFVGTEKIRGLQSLWRRPRFQLTIGEPFFVEEARPNRGSDQIMEAIAELLPPERRGRYGKHPGAASGSRPPNDTLRERSTTVVGGD